MQRNGGKVEQKETHHNSAGKLRKKEARREHGMGLETEQKLTPGGRPSAVLVL